MNVTGQRRAVIAVGLPVTQQPPHRSRRAVFPHRALRTASLPHLLPLFPSVRLTLPPALLVRFGVSFEGYGCPSVPSPCDRPYRLVGAHGRVPLRADPTPWRLRLSYSGFRFGLPVTCRGRYLCTHPGTTRASQVPDASLHASHALCEPRQTLGGLTLSPSLCWLPVR